MVYFPNSSRAFPTLVLHVEDNANDRSLMELAAEEVDARFALRGCSTLEEARHYLQGGGEYADRRRHPLPGLLLLDFHLGLRTGAQLLRWVRGQPELLTLPVIVFSDADALPVIAECYGAGASHFLVKPSSFTRLRAVVKLLGQCAAGKPPCYDPLCCLPESRVLTGGQVPQAPAEPSSDGADWRSAGPQ